MQVKSISPLEDGFLRKLEFIALKPKILYYYGKSPGDAVDSEVEGEKNISEKSRNTSLCTTEDGGRRGV